MKTFLSYKSTSRCYNYFGKCPIFWFWRIFCKYSEFWLKNHNCKFNHDIIIKTDWVLFKTDWVLFKRIISGEQHVTVSVKTITLTVLGRYEHFFGVKFSWKWSKIAILSSFLSFFGQIQRFLAILRCILLKKVSVATE